MRIALFTDTYTPHKNGVVSVVRTLEAGLREHGHEVLVFTVAHPHMRSTRHVVRIPSFPFPWEAQYRVALPAALRVLRRCQRFKADIVHSHTPFSIGLLANFAARRLSVPSFHTYHTYFEEYFHYLPLGSVLRRFARSASRGFCDKQSAVIAPSKKMEQLLLGYGLAVPVHVVPNGIDLSHFAEKRPSAQERQEFRSKLSISERERVILYVGRIAKEKSVGILLENFSRVAKRLPDVTLLVVGDGPEKTRMRQLADRLGVLDRVVFAGYLQWPNQIALAYASSDLFASASHTEIHPIVYIEALATGLPIVTFSDSSIEDMVRDGENGFKYTDKARLHEGMLRILSDPVLKKEMAVQSSRIGQEFSLTNFTKRMESVYRLYRSGPERAVS